MTAVTVSPKYQVVIPKEIRESLGIVSGQKVEMIVAQGLVHMVPVRPMREMRGFLKGKVDPNFEREPDREL